MSDANRGSHATANRDLDQLCIDTIRTLSMDAIQAARSGHPGAPMGMAPIAYVLWQRHLRYDPEHPLWPDRDRFVLSAGHASMLLYSLLHLAGVKAAPPQVPEGNPEDRPAVTLEDIRRFRQLGSPCAGHPEYGLLTGVETTTGPLGQGAATSVGMALASRWLGARHAAEDGPLFRHDVYALLGDGCMQEGVTAEAASLAGHQGLGNLCWIYDSNRITIEGATDVTFTEDVAARFAAYGWSVEHVADANDLDALDEAFQRFHGTEGRPTLIVVQSHIAFGSPNRQDTAKAHGEPLGEEEVRLTKRAYGWPEDATFRVPPEVRAHFAAGLGRRGAEEYAAWQARYAAYRERHPKAAAALEQMRTQRLPQDWDADLPVFPADPKGIATRAASGKALAAVAPRIPWLLGGSADLAPSNKTWLPGQTPLSASDPGGRNIHFGVREHAMGAVANGLALSGLRPYDATFLVFADYFRPAIRLGAMMALPVIHVLTHDSIGVGEDGPTHQPVEHLASLRAIPGLYVLRPADANETVAAWRFALEQSRRPVALILSRQAIPVIDRERFAAPDVGRGGYVLADSEEPPELILLASGSEIALCLEAWEALVAEGVRARVVSMVSFELFEEQDSAYKEAVLPAAARARVAVEQAVSFGWHRYVGAVGAVISMERFGESAPFADLRAHFGFTVERILDAARTQLSGLREA